MRRVVSLWFPHWPTDRLRRRLAQSPEAPPHDQPLVTAVHDGRRRVIAAVDQVAAALGLRAGMAVAQALAVVPGLQVHEAEPDADADALRLLARWCNRMTPLVSIDAPDGVWLDVTGCSHLFGEAALLHGLVARLARDGLLARAAVADTPGAAHAMVRFGTACTVLPQGEHWAGIAPLPVAALRLPPELDATLRRLGFEQVGHLARIPRALLARRFGPLPGLRLDQAHGRVHEPLAPLPPEHLLQHRISFLEPLLTAEALQIATDHLVGPLCAEMERSGLGARQLDLLFERVDGQVAAVRVGTARPSRAARHLAQMLNERLDTVDPGLGVEAMRLVVSLAEPLQWEQQEGDAVSQDVARLVDRLTNRLGADRVYGLAPRDSDMPEQSVQKIPPLSLAMPGPVPPPVTIPHREMPPLPRIRRQAGHLRLIDPFEDRAASPEPDRQKESGSPQDPPAIPWKGPWALRNVPPTRSPLPWPGRLQPPVRLLHPPRPIEALAALPDQPPVSFTWRRRRHRVRRADGPERVFAEWWCTDDSRSVRDYFQVEDETGQRFWLFRNGNGLDLDTGDLSWFLHGLF